MRHYLFLSAEHAVRKYVQREYDADELAKGWHRVRSRLRAQDIRLQDESTLRVYAGDAALDPADPLTTHPLFAQTSREISV
jgi:hypothetical protein